MTGKTQRAAELRDAAARSLLEYETDKQERCARLKLAAAPAPLDAFELMGDIAEMVTAIESVAADADDTVLSQAVSGLRSQVTRVGNVLARRRAMYREGGDA